MLTDDGTARVEFPRVKSLDAPRAALLRWIVRLRCVGNLLNMRIVTVRCPLVVKSDSGLIG
jgi:hypothetical protein